MFERLTHAQLPFYLHLMKHLAQHGVPVPEPRAKPDGAPVPAGEDDLLHTVCGKPAALVNRLRGKSELHPGPAHCAAVGDMLARAHLAARDYDRHQPNLRGLAWWNETVPVVLPYLDESQATLIRGELMIHLAGQAIEKCGHEPPPRPPRCAPRCRCSRAAPSRRRSRATWRGWRCSR